MGGQNLLDEEIESWKGFPWALRKEDLELWDAMIREVMDGFGEAAERLGKALATDPFFMVLFLAQRKMIRQLQAKLNSHEPVKPNSASLQKTLD